MEKTRKNKTHLRKWLETLVVAGSLVFIIQYFFFAPMIINGKSMNTTLKHGDRVVVSKIGKIDRFDVVVFNYDGEQEYIKRIIGLPNDKIEYINDVLYINGKKQEEPYLEEIKAATKQGQLTANFKVEKVSEGHVFLLGDNRRNSEDSRHIGEIDMKSIIGKADIVYWPINRMHKLGKINE